MRPTAINRHTQLRIGLLVLATILSFAAPTAVAADTAYLEFESSGLEALGPDFVYEGWLIVDGAAVSAGRFSVLADGSLSRSEFAIEVDDLDAVTTYVLTIEPAVDADPGPSHVHILGGDFAGGTAELSAGHGAALGDDFSSAAGQYILAAPSGGGSAGYENGIWWLDPGAGPGASLELPELPAGWVYEGWVANADGAVTTGRFSVSSGADSDAGGISAGPHATPPFPGQDFVAFQCGPVLDLDSGSFAAVVSIEPVPDNGKGPFQLKPLAGAIETDALGRNNDLGNQTAATFPTGTAFLMGPVSVDASSWGSIKSLYR